MIIITSASGCLSISRQCLIFLSPEYVLLLVFLLQPHTLKTQDNSSPFFSTTTKNWTKPFSLKHCKVTLKNFQIQGLENCVQARVRVRTVYAKSLERTRENEHAILISKLLERYFT